MSSWLIQATERCLKPVYDLLKKKLLKEDILHADETTPQIHRDLRISGNVPCRVPREFLQGYWAHARRKSDEAMNVITPNDRASSKAMQGKRFCDALFSAEDKLNHLAWQERTEKRRELAEPILAEFQKWLASIHPTLKSAMGRAAAYAQEQWPYLTHYLLDGRLEISNNRAERSIKPLVMERKNPTSTHIATLPD